MPKSIVHVPDAGNAAPNIEPGLFAEGSKVQDQINDQANDEDGDESGDDDKEDLEARARAAVQDAARPNAVKVGRVAARDATT